MDRAGVACADCIATQSFKEIVMSASRPWSIAALVLATTAWGSLFIVGKPTLAHLDPLWFTFVRYTLATLGFAVLLLARGAVAWRPLRQQGLQLAALGFVGYGVFGTLVLLGLAHSVPSHGAVVMATMPITTQLMRWLLDGQRPHPGSVVGTALALAGVLIVSGVATGSAGHASTLPGDVTAWVGTLGWVTYTRYAGRMGPLDPLAYSALTAIASWPLLLGAVVVGAATGVSPVPSVEALQLSAPAMLYIGLVPSIVAILAFNFGVRTLGVVAGTGFLNLVPLSAIAIGTALGHVPQAHELVGAALVITALMVHLRGQGAQPASLQLRHEEPASVA
jgi:drug/metabolite transporter (DMT)-like permease